MPVVSEPRHPFVESLRERFPELRPALDWYAITGLLHLEVGAFSRASADAFNAGDLATVRAHFSAVEEALTGSDEALNLALLIEYAEDFALGTPHEQTARRMMPARLAAAFDEAEAWHAHRTAPTLRR